MPGSLHVVAVVAAECETNKERHIFTYSWFKERYSGRSTQTKLIAVVKNGRCTVEHRDALLSLLW